MAVSTEVVTSPLQRMAATTPTDYWNDSSSVEELTYAIARGATGATSNPTIVGEVLRKELHLWSHRIPADRRRQPGLDGGRGHLEAHRGDLGARLGAAAADLRARGRPQGAPLDPDGPEVLPRRCADHRSGPRLLRARAEHAGEGARDEGRDPGRRGSDRSRRRHQRDRQLHRPAGDRRCRGGRAWTRATRGGGR